MPTSLPNRLPKAIGGQSMILDAQATQAAIAELLQRCAVGEHPSLEWLSGWLACLEHLGGLSAFDSQRELEELLTSVPVHPVPRKPRSTLYPEGVQQVQWAVLLSRIANQICNSQDLEAVGAFIIHELGQAMEADQAALAVYDPYAGTLVLNAEYRSPGSPVRPLQGAHLEPKDWPSSTWAFRSGQPWAIADINIADLEPTERMLLNQYSWRSVLQVPMITRGGLIGAVLVSQSTPRCWSAAEITLVQQVAGQAAIALTQARLYQETRAQAEREALLGRINDRIRQSLDIDTILDTALTELLGVVQADVVNFGKPTGAEADCLYISHEVHRVGSQEGRWGEDTPLPVQLHLSENSLFLNQIRNQYPVMIEDTRHHPGLSELERQTFELRRMRSVLSLPLCYQNTLIGSLTAYNHSPYPWQPEEIDAAHVVANQLVVAITHAQLYEVSRARAEREMLLNRIANRIRATLDLDDILQTTVDEVRQLLQVQRCNFFWYRPERGCFALTHESREPGLDSLIGEFNVEELGQLGEHLLRRERVQIDSIATHPLLCSQSRTLLLQTGFRSDLILPVEASDAPLDSGLASTTSTAANGELGFIECVECSTERQWTSETVELLQAVADQLAVAITQAQLYAASRRQAEREALLNRITAAARSSLDRDAILETIVTQVGEGLGVERCHLYQRHTDTNGKPGLLISHSYCNDPWAPNLVNTHWAADDLGEIFEALLRQETVVIPDRCTDIRFSEFCRQMCCDLDPGSGLLVPIVQYEDDPDLTSTRRAWTWGVLGLTRKGGSNQPASFAPADITLAQTVGDQLSVAITQAELYQQTRYAAQQAQIRARREQALNAVVTAIRSSLDLDQILNQAVKGLAQALQADRCLLFIRPDYSTGYSESDGFQITHEYRTGPSQSLLGYTWSAEVLAQDYPIWWHLHNSDSPHSSDDVTQDPLLGDGGAGLLALGVKAQIFALIRRSDTRAVIGGVMLHDCKSPRRWQLADTRTVVTITDQLAIAINQARLYNETRAAAEREALLNQIISALHHNLELGTLTRQVAQGLTEALDVTRVSVWLFSPDYRLLECCHLFSRDPNEAGVLPCPPPLEVADFPVYFEAISQWLPLVVDNTRSDPHLNELYPAYLERAQIFSTLDMPIVRPEADDALSMLDSPEIRANAEESPVPPGTSAGLQALSGILCIEQCNAPRVWQADEVSLVEAVADQLAVAINQVQLVHRTREAAADARAQAENLRSTLDVLQATQAQLVQTEKMSSLGQMVAGVAHEINNPISFIHGNVPHATTYIQDCLTLLDLYRQHMPEPPTQILEFQEHMDLDFVREDLTAILRSMRTGTERVREIVLTLRNFSRLDETDKKPADLNEGIESTLLLLQNRLKQGADRKAPYKGGIEVIRDYSELPPLLCYPGQLNQVFLNLLSNAVDALRSSDPRERGNETACITIKTGCTGAAIQVQIIDNGPGIPPQIQPRLFDPFFTTKPVGEGTGLGLSICYRIVVDHHQGSIRCESKPGQGTIFVVEIPLG
ncbi:GAF domain-containing protein [Leptolyngbya sp. FACHB-261]|uniref:GAF domain-containing protein n=1 Tax=Leptolyngbya sp. FACHB-261 TaxID=2692806 RepID=UPI0016822BB9|nr:GAF domain-containing protein [Leptolyngbya sp. FACHB-261]MBD2104522.1 GAF domain-containing protein [Leptolyngbya sp. FACHB-261]